MFYVISQIKSKKETSTVICRSILFITGFFFYVTHNFQEGILQLKWN